MADKPKSMTRKEMEQKIVALAWKDDSFRKNFVKDPKGEFEKRLGVKLPGSLKMSAHQETENALFFVIPVKPAGKAGELSDRDLEKVAGGAGAPLSLTSVDVNVPMGTVVQTQQGTGWKNE